MKFIRFRIIGGCALLLCCSADGFSVAGPEKILAPAIRLSREPMRRDFSGTVHPQLFDWIRHSRPVPLMFFRNPPPDWFPVWKELAAESNSELLLFPANLIPDQSVSVEYSAGKPAGLTFLGIINRGVPLGEMRSLLTELLSDPRYEFWPQAVASDNLLILNPDSVGVFDAAGRSVSGVLSGQLSESLRQLMFLGRESARKANEVLHLVGSADAAVLREKIAAWKRDDLSFVVEMNENIGVIVSGGLTASEAHLIAKKLLRRLQRASADTARIPGVVLVHVVSEYEIVLIPAGGITIDKAISDWLSRRIERMQTRIFISDLHLAGGRKKGWYMDREKETALIALLAWARRWKIGVVVDGDLFDFWIQRTYRKIVSHHKKLVDAFRRLPDLTIIAGNHDQEILLPELSRRLEEDFGTKRIVPFYFNTDSGLFVEHGHGREREIGRMAVEGKRRKKFTRTAYMEYLGFSLNAVQLEVQQLRDEGGKSHNFPVPKTSISRIFTVIRVVSRIISYVPVISPPNGIAHALLNYIFAQFAPELVHHHGESDYYFPENIAVGNLLTSLTGKRRLTIVQGHTHSASIGQIGFADGRIVRYANTGSWAYSADPRVLPPHTRNWFLRLADGTMLRFDDVSDGTLLEATTRVASAAVPVAVRIEPVFSSSCPAVPTVPVRAVSSVPPISAADSSL